MSFSAAAAAGEPPPQTTTPTTPVQHEKVIDAAAAAAAAMAMAAAGRHLHPLPPISGKSTIFNKSFYMPNQRPFRAPSSGMIGIDV